MLTIKKNKNNFYLSIFFVTFFLFGFFLFSNAQVSNTSAYKNDFVLEPGKVEVFANPGESVRKSITVTNRASTVVSFKIEVEDFIGSTEENMPVILLGEEKSPYSFKDNVVPDVSVFSLEPNTSITVPITITIPDNAQPGGLYTSVLVSNQPSVDLQTNASGAEGKTKIISRVGTLFFIRVNGVAKESGELEDFIITKPTKKFPDTYKFNILFKNDGNVHLVPYGWITVRNIFGKDIGKIPVDAYFAMPKSIRYREIQWNKPPSFGRFVATVDLNRGYGSDLIDTKTVSFWIIPWKVALIAIIILLTIFFGLYSFFKKFKLVAKQ